MPRGRKVGELHGPYGIPDGKSELRDARIRMGFTQRELAAALGVGYTSVRKLEYGMVKCLPAWAAHLIDRSI